MATGVVQERVLATAEDLEKLRGLRSRAALRDFVDALDLSAFLGRFLYRFGETLYLRLSYPSPGVRDDCDPGALVITGILFAADDGAAMRCTAMAIELDQGLKAAVPADFLPGAGEDSYGSILAGLKRSGVRVCQESAEYRIGKDGQFVHRLIETERCAYYFRGSLHDDSERPYAVLLKLRSG